MKIRYPILQIFARIAVPFVALLWLIVCPARVAHADDISDGQWYASELQLESANEISSGEGIIVAIIDSGVEADHPELQGSVLPGADFTNSALASEGDGRQDNDGHGTAMASLIVGHGRIRGVAPRAMILPVRLGSGAQRTNYAAAIRWSVSHGADVINISGAAPLADPRERDAIDYAIDRGVIVVAGVGNLPEAASVQYPARYPRVVAVGATGRNRNHLSISARGADIALCAPGEKISSARQNGGYALATGTSDSTALVSGVVALVRSRYPNIAASEAIRRITATALDNGPYGRDDMCGYGVVRPLEALLATSIPTTEPTDGSSNSESRLVGAPPEGGAVKRDLWRVLLVIVVVIGVAFGAIIVVMQKRAA